MNDRLWPMGIAAVAAIVVAVNFAFIYISQQHAPEISPSYEHNANR